MHNFDIYNFWHSFKDKRIQRTHVRACTTDPSVTPTRLQPVQTTAVSHSQNAQQCKLTQLISSSDNPSNRSSACGFFRHQHSAFSFIMYQPLYLAIMISVRYNRPLIISQVAFLVLKCLIIKLPSQHCTTHSYLDEKAALWQEMSRPW